MIVGLRPRGVLLNADTTPPNAFGLAGSPLGERTIALPAPTSALPHLRRASAVLGLIPIRLGGHLPATRALNRKALSKWTRARVAGLGMPVGEVGSCVATRTNSLTGFRFFFSSFFGLTFIWAIWVW